MNVLIIGSGGREHAMAWQIRRFGHQVWVSPGNPGTAQEPGIVNLAVDGEVATWVDIAREYHIDLTIVGPEAPLAAGIVDAFQAAGLGCFGPTQAAAQLESSKVFAKAFLQRHGIPTAAYDSFDDPLKALDFARGLGFPVVIKADGLAAGKGVTIAHNADDASEAINEALSGQAFGAAGCRIVVEEFLHGEEASFIVLVDGKSYLSLASSQDHKARDDGDQGPNTGGMGAYSPAPVVDAAVHQRIVQTIIEPTVRAMATEGMPYTGFLYAGVMIDAAGKPRVLEFNCRLGDPETQPIMMRLQSDLADLCNAALMGELHRHIVAWDPRSALGVVLAAQGYPGSVRRDDPITLPTVEEADRKLFFAGVAQHGEVLLTAGGRVMCATALGSTIEDARQRAYRLAEQVRWEGRFYRSDIGHRALARDTDR